MTDVILEVLLRIKYYPMQSWKQNQADALCLPILSLFFLAIVIP
jgi:hypothetical protein